jgi:hypothetical protein
LQKGLDSTPLSAESQLELEALADMYLGMAQARGGKIKKTTAVEAELGGKATMLELNKADLEKAAKVKEHIQNMDACNGKYFSDCEKITKAHRETMTGHFAQLHKLLGFGPTSDKPEPINPEAGATDSPTLEEKGASKVEKVASSTPAMEGYMTKAEAQELMSKGVHEMLVALVGGEEVANQLIATVEQPVTKAAAGIGNRDESILARSQGPIIKVMPVSKVDDVSNPASATPTPAAAQIVALTPDVMQKALSGDKDALNKVMGSVQPSAIPITLMDVVGGRAAAGR